MRSERAALPLALLSMGVLLMADPMAGASPRSPGAAGDLDAAFGQGGTVTTQLGYGGASDVIVEPDGRIVVAGTAGSDFVVTRYLEDGTLDVGFGHGGVVRRSVGDLPYVTGAALQVDGKIVVAGSIFDGQTDENEFALIRLRRNGSADRGFGDQGSVLTSFPGGAGANDLALQPDGRIVASGVASGRFALARYEADGSLDPTFGHDGKEVRGSGYAYALAIQTDGKLVAAGSATGGAIAVNRYRPNGRFDTTFGDHGRVVTSFDGYDDVDAEDVAVQPNGRIVVVGDALQPGHDRFAMARYRSDGTLDPSFGAGGEVTTSFPAPFFEAFARTVALQADGRIVAAGFADTLDRRYFAMARYLHDGRRDRSFGDGGTVITDFGMDADAAASAMQGDGKVVLAGAYLDGFALARYLGS